MSAKKNKAARSARAAKAAELRRQQEQAERRRRMIVTGVIAVVVVAIVGVTVFAVTQSRKNVAAGPDGATDDYGYLLTSANAPSPSTSSETTAGSTAGDAVPVAVYEDFQCPVCKEFESTTGQFLRGQAESGEITLEYRVVGFLDRASSTDYSSRAANAAACVVDDSGIEAFLGFHDVLYANQPPEGGDGLTDDQLKEYAHNSGASSGVDGCIDSRTYDSWVDQASDAASKADVTGTPTIWVDGKRVGDEGTVPTGDQIVDAIDAARG